MADNIYSAFGVSPNDYEYDPSTDTIRLKSTSTFDDRWNLPSQPQQDIVGNVPNVPTIQVPPDPNTYGLPVQFQKYIPEIPDASLVNDYQVSSGVPALNKLFGLEGERFQTWPERMARSGSSAPGDAYAGLLPVESPTGYPGSIAAGSNDIQMEPRALPKLLGMGNFTVPSSESEIARVQDLAGMAGMSGIGMTPKGALGTSGSRLEGFYSNLERTIANSKVDKATPEQWTSYLKNQPGIKSEELEFSGLNELKELFEGGKVPVTKDQLLEHIAENGVKLGEVWKGDIVKELPEGFKIKSQKEYSGRTHYYVETPSGRTNKAAWNSPEAATEAMIRELNAPSKYSSYQLPGGPLSKDTEILTRDGWKRIDCVSIGEEIISRKDSGELEWQPIQAIPFVYAEKLYHFFSQSIDMQVTDNHKMVVKKRRRSSRGLYRISAKELWQSGECVIPLTGIWNGQGTGEIFGMNAEDVAEFIGWYLAEGSYKKSLSGAKNTIQIAQSRTINPSNCDILEALFDRLGFSWRYYGDAYGVGIKSMNKDLMQLLHNQPNSSGKFVPKFLFNQSQKVIHALLRGLILGDGCITKTEHQDRYMFFSKSKQLADDVQILVLLAGNRASVRQRPSGLYSVGINRKEWCSVDDAKYAIVDYNDFAYCVTVENHCIYVRRNGVAAFTGNSDYRELLLTVPEKLKSWTWQNGEPVTKADLADPFTRASAERVGMKEHEVAPYQSSHWDEPNVLAHIRMNDRDIPNVGKTLHIEEIQSDWHQAGRKSGYKGQNKEEIPQGWGDTSSNSGTVPNAPFKKSWDELALKRALTEAVKGNYDALSWTPGEAQAARYDLSKQVQSIDWKPSGALKDSTIVKINPNNTEAFRLQIGKDGKVMNSFPSSTGDQFVGKNLSDIIGKEHADKILSKEEGNLEGEGLKIGGEGMKAFYDKMLVNKADQLVKKMGGKVEYSTDVVYPQLNNKIGEKPTETKVPYIRITPQMRDKIKNEGFSLFTAPVYVPVDHDPFERKLTKVDHNPFQMTPVNHTPEFE